MQQTVELSHTFTDNGVVERANVLGKVTERFFNLRALTAEAAVREKLVRMGWTPPGEPDKETYIVVPAHQAILAGSLDEAMDLAREAAGPAGAIIAAKRHSIIPLSGAVRTGSKSVSR